MKEVDMEQALEKLTLGEEARVKFYTDMSTKLEEQFGNWAEVFGQVSTLLDSLVVIPNPNLTELEKLSRNDIISGATMMLIQYIAQKGDLADIIAAGTSTIKIGLSLHTALDEENRDFGFNSLTNQLYGSLGDMMMHIIMKVQIATMGKSLLDNEDEK
jgi:hypothetical protein